MSPDRPRVPGPLRRGTGDGGLDRPRGTVGDGGRSESRPPVVFISSDDEVEPPALRGARQLGELAAAAGWSVKVTYAVAFVPTQYHLNGGHAKAAHWLRSIVVRLQRSDALGWAVWHAEDEARWAFASAFVNFARHGWGRGAKLPSILERVSA